MNKAPRTLHRSVGLKGPLVVCLVLFDDDLSWQKSMSQMSCSSDTNEVLFTTYPGRNKLKLGFTTAGSGATGSSGHAVVDEFFAHVSRPV